MSLNAVLSALDTFLQKEEGVFNARAHQLAAKELRAALAAIPPEVEAAVVAPSTQPAAATPPAPPAA